MSAPTTAYLTEVLPISNGTITDDLYLAINLTDYAGNMKDLFYIDYFLSAEKGFAKGLIGIIEDDNTLINYILRNSSRFSKITLTNPAGTKTYVALNDGGLNIKSLVEWVSEVAIKANEIRIETNCFVPYYNYDTTLSIDFSVYRGGVFSSLEIASRLYTITNRGLLLNTILSIVDSDKFEAGDVVYYTIKTVNEEGTFNEGTTRTFNVKPAIVRWNTGAWPSLAVNFPTGYLDLRFVKVPFVLGDTFYLDDVLGTTAPAGYYADFEKWYQLDASGVLIDEGWIGSWPTGDPAAPVDYSTIAHYGYKTTFVNMIGYLDGFIDYDAGTGWDATIDIYRSNRGDATDGKYYDNTALTSLVSNGYYVRPYGGGDRTTLQSSRYLNFIRIVSGLITETWEFDTIEMISNRID